MNEMARLRLRLEAADGTLRVTAALRTAVEALAYYMGGEDPEKARSAIARIEAQLDPEATPSPLAGADGKEASPRKRKRAPSTKGRKP